MNDTDETYQDETESLENSSSVESSEQNGKKNKVVFKTSYPSAGLDRPERQTPNTDLKDIPQHILNDKSLKPDLSFYCNECESYSNLSEMNEHKQYHIALKILGLQNLQNKSEEDLIKIRKTLIDSALNKYLNKQKDFETKKANDWSHKVNQINNAYEIVRSYVDNTFESNRQIRVEPLTYDYHGESSLSINDSILAIGYCFTQNKSHRQSMQDKNIVLENFGENKNFTYCATFDGYDGDVASNRCVQQLHLAILYNLSKQKLNTGLEFIRDKFMYDEINYLEKYSNSEEYSKIEDTWEEKNVASSRDEINQIDFNESFIKAYHQMDKLLARGRGETSKLRWSGCTGCTCIIENNPENDDGWIHIANCGDVEAIVVLKDDDNKQKKYKLLTRLHTLNAYPKDRERIEKNHGRIVETSPGVKKIEGLYNITRALGFHGDKNIKKFIKPTPSIRSYKIESNFICLIIATKGIWNTLSYKSVCDLIFECLPKKSPLNEPPISPSVQALLEKINKDKSNMNTDEIEDNFSLKSKSIENSFEMRLKTGNLKGSYRNYQDNIRNLSSTPTDFKMNAFHTDNDDDEDEQFYNVNRPRTVPHELSDFGKDEYKPKQVKKSSTKKKKQEQESEQTKKHYSFSDIYPLKQTNVLMNQKNDLKIDMDDIKDLNIQDFNLQLHSSDETDDKNKMNTKIETDYKSIQVNEHDVRKYIRDTMENRIHAKRLEVSETIVEKLVTSALLAGSTDNITVNCFLLDGFDL